MNERLKEDTVPTSWGKMFYRYTDEPQLRQCVPSVLVPGMVISGNYMIPLAKQLSPYCRSYIVDFPGYGRSEKPAETLDVPKLARALSEWMEGVGIKKANLVANSFGCQVAAEFAVRYPEKVDHLVLQGPTVDEHARGFWRQWYRLRKNSHRESKSVGTISVKDYKRAGATRVVKSIRMTLRDRIEDKLPLVQAPTLVVRGDQDPVVPQEWAEKVTSLLPHGQLCVIEGGAHTLNYSEPEKLSAAIRPFLGLQ